MSDVVRCSRVAKSGKLVYPEIPAQSAVVGLFEPASVANQAVLYSYTTIHPNPKSGLLPFSLGYADFDGELRVFGRLGLPDGEKPEVGMALRLEAQADAPDGPGYLLVPAKD